jgi:hypothetical protein
VPEIKLLGPGHTSHAPMEIGIVRDAVLTLADFDVVPLMALYARHPGYLNKFVRFIHEMMFLVDEF